jgi:long-chain acyl-CoA synthetase
LPEQLLSQAKANLGYDTHRLTCLASLEHNNAKRHRLYTVMCGGTNVFRGARDVNLMEFCGRHGVTRLEVAAIHASGLVATVKGRPLDSVEIRISGSLVPPALRSGLEANVTRKVSVRYGATECGTIAVTAEGKHAGETVGRPSVGVIVEIVDPAGAPLAPGQSGDIRVRTPGSASGYLDDPDLSASRFRDGWFLTGDIGHFNLDGELVVEGRRDDMMILNGINIFPAEIEEALELHHAVRSAAAAAVRSATHGDIPVAIVELRQGAELTQEELLIFARQRLALRAPRRIAIVDQIPRNPQGKVLRQRVLEIVVSGKHGHG